MTTRRVNTAPLAPIRLHGGYPPLEDHGLIGDGTTAALVARDGAIAWLCLPRFDGTAVFCRILDHARGGHFTIAPEGLTESRQYYDGETGILVTELRCDSGLIRITDALTLRSGADLTEDAPAGRGELLRSVTVVQGSARVRITVEPRGGATGEAGGGGIRLRCNAHPDITLHLSANLPLAGLDTTLDMVAGQRLDVLLRWSKTSTRYKALEPEELLTSTREAWTRWTRHIRYEGPQKALVRRSAITLKLLDHFQNGAMVAAPTSSLPAPIGGTRNWDYRYTWIRDASFSVYALYRIGLEHEAAGFLTWVLDAVERHGRPRVLYNLDGEEPQPEWEDPELEGYRNSRPVRWGNAAAYQVQHDVYGDVLDCAYQWSRHSGQLEPSLWRKLRALVEAARVEWLRPDHGIWEIRAPGRLFTYSAALCQVALDRGARLAQTFSLPGDATGWQEDAEHIRRRILDEAWDAEAGSLTEHLGGGGLDASLLTLPLRRVIDANHPRMVATTEAIMARLGAGDGLLYRYLPDESPDGLPGHDGAFLLCSFWLVDNLAKQGRLQEATDLYDSLCARASPLGLLSEQIDPGSGAFMGNFPQAFSHIGPDLKRR